MNDVELVLAVVEITVHSGSGQERRRENELEGGQTGEGDEGKRKPEASNG